MMRYLLGIDDTDNLETRGTGHRVRKLAEWLVEGQLAQPLGITRHQLLVDPRIPYTSHNSSACVLLDLERVEAVWEAACQFMQMTAATGSDVGVVLAEWQGVTDEVRDFGARAKAEVLTISLAQETAARSGLRCVGLTGTGGGVIGALAGVGLHHAGNDGRFLWLPGLRELRGKYPVNEVLTKGHIQRVCTLAAEELSAESIIDVGEWVRPVLRDGRSTLFVEEQNHEWRVLSKDRIKSLSN